MVRAPVLYKPLFPISSVRGSIVVSIPACHAGDRGSIPRRGAFLLFFFLKLPVLSLEDSNDCTVYLFQE